jgi:hypothetical protein
MPSTQREKKAVTGVDEVAEELKALHTACGSKAILERQFGSY